MRSFRNELIRLFERAFVFFEEEFPSSIVCTFSPNDSILLNDKLWLKCIFVAFVVKKMLKLETVIKIHDRIKRGQHCEVVEKSCAF